MKYIDWNSLKTYKYCDNTHNYCTCRWTHFSSIDSILASIATILNEYCRNTWKYLAGEYTLCVFNRSVKRLWDDNISYWPPCTIGCWFKSITTFCNKRPIYKKAFLTYFCFLYILQSSRLWDTAIAASQNTSPLRPLFLFRGC